MCVQSLRLGRFFYIHSRPSSSSNPIFFTLSSYEELTSEVAGPLIGSKNACVGVLVVMSKEALTESVAIPVAVQHTVTVLVVSESVFLTTSFMLLVSEGVPVVLLIKVFHEGQERIRVGGSI